MRSKSKALLTPEGIQQGMEAVRSWYENHPNKKAPVIFSASDQDSWTPESILRTLEAREESGDWGHDDIPEMILKSISKSRQYVSL